MPLLDVSISCKCSGSTLLMTWMYVAMNRLQVKGLDDEIGSEAAQLLSKLVGGGKKLRATIVAGQLASSQPVQVLEVFPSDKGLLGSSNQ